MSLLPKETLRYVLQYGGRCRDCADHLGICPNSGLPCAEAGKAIKWVIDAINYGAKHGYLKVSPFPPSERNADENTGGGQ